MGYCASVQENPDSTMGFLLGLGSQAKRFFIPSPANEKSLNGQSSVGGFDFKGKVVDSGAGLGSPEFELIKHGNCIMDEVRLLYLLENVIGIFWWRLGHHGVGSRLFHLLLRSFLHLSIMVDIIKIQFFEEDRWRTQTLEVALAAR
uniref:Uncharacterized protein LOC105033982 n=1 Tax=Elaeis guineensis var. tenera TaxID=51953 RepID=A0A8N4I662_ELAGV|nr:uncharacterized protein LOC105033982 [Elaeis guineensis]